MTARGVLSAARRLVWVALMLVGGWLVYQPFAHSAELGRYADQLRRTGRPVQATVVTELMRYRHPKSGADQPVYESFLRYDVGDRTEQVAFACDSPCPRDGATVQIWVDPNDPTDYVDEFGTLSGNRNDSRAAVGLLGLVPVFLGFVVLVWPRRDGPEAGDGLPPPTDPVPAEPARRRRSGRRIHGASGRSRAR